MLDWENTGNNCQSSFGNCMHRLLAGRSWSKESIIIAAMIHLTASLKSVYLLFSVVIHPLFWILKVTVDLSNSTVNLILSCVDYRRMTIHVLGSSVVFVAGGCSLKPYHIFETYFFARDWHSRMDEISIIGNQIYSYVFKTAISKWRTLMTQFEFPCQLYILNCHGSVICLRAPMHQWQKRFKSRLSVPLGPNNSWNGMRRPFALSRWVTLFGAFFQASLLQTEQDN